MILPTKHISLKDCYLGTGMTILKAVNRPMNATKLWQAVAAKPNVATAQRFYKTLDILFMLGAISFSRGKLRRN